MTWGLITFLFGCLILLVVLYVFRQVLAAIPGLDPPIKNIVLLIVGLIALIVLLSLTIHAFMGGFGPGPYGLP